MARKRPLSLAEATDRAIAAENRRPYTAAQQASDEAMARRLEIRQIMCDRTCGGGGGDCIHFGEFALSDQALGIAANPNVESAARGIPDRFAREG